MSRSNRGGRLVSWLLAGRGMEKSRAKEVDSYSPDRHGNKPEELASGDDGDSNHGDGDVKHGGRQFKRFMSAQMGFGKILKRFSLELGLLFLEVIFRNLLQVTRRRSAIERNQDFGFCIQQVILERLGLVIGPFVVGFDALVGRFGEVGRSQGAGNSGKGGQKRRR